MSYTVRPAVARLQQQQQAPAQEEPMCQCNAPAQLLQVKKQNQNHGRWFYTCSTCNFFQWAAGPPPSSTPPSGSSPLPAPPAPPALAAAVSAAGGSAPFASGSGRLLGSGSCGGPGPSSLPTSPTHSRRPPQDPAASPQQTQPPLPPARGSPAHPSTTLPSFRPASELGTPPGSAGDAQQRAVWLDLVPGAPDRFQSRQRFSRDFVNAVKSTGKQNTDYKWDEQGRIWTFALTYASYHLLTSTLGQAGFVVHGIPAHKLQAALGDPPADPVGQVAWGGKAVAPSALAHGPGMPSPAAAATPDTTAGAAGAPSGSGRAKRARALFPPPSPPRSAPPAAAAAAAAAVARASRQPAPPAQQASESCVAQAGAAGGQNAGVQDLLDLMVEDMSHPNQAVSRMRMDQDARAEVEAELDAEQEEMQKVVSERLRNEMERQHQGPQQRTRLRLRLPAAQRQQQQQRLDTADGEVQLVGEMRQQADLRLQQQQQRQQRAPPSRRNRVEPILHWAAESMQGALPPQPPQPRVSAVIDLTADDDDQDGGSGRSGGGSRAVGLGGAAGPGRASSVQAPLGQDPGLATRHAARAAAVARAQSAAAAVVAREQQRMGDAPAACAAAAEGPAEAAEAAAAEQGGAGGVQALECVICLSAPREMGLLHGATMHLCVCKDCSKIIKLRTPCPICRAPVSKIISVFT